MALSDDAVWRLSVAYIGPMSRKERTRKIKIGTEVAHVTRDSDNTSKVQRSKTPGRFGLLYWQANMDIELGLVTDPYACMMYIVITGRPERGHIVSASRLQLVST